jgi:hypothetical protein
MEDKTMKTGILNNGLYEIDGLTLEFDQLHKLYPHRYHVDKMFYSFDSHQELMDYVYPNIWRKDDYVQKVSSMHDELFKSYYETYGYEGKDEIPLWFDNLKYGEEAKALSDWYCSTWETLENHFEIVTENTADAEQIIKSLPPFQINKP